MGGGASTAGAQPRYKWHPDHVLRGPWTFIFKEKVQCACEGSKWCTRENPAKQKTPNAIPGLHSSWVAGSVLAMARPWQSHVLQYNMVQSFKDANIGMILNLQEVGEHASCGPGNLPHCGFTYDPETFMAAGVGYYNFSWRDMGVPNLDRMMDIVQVMDYVTRVEGRRIAVHCHAGLGRTGLSIACFFVYANMYATPEEAIKAVRKDRLGAVQTSKQVAFVTIFSQYLQHLRCLFVPRPGGLAAHAHHGSAASLASSSGPSPSHSLATHSAPPAAGMGGKGAEPGGLLPQEGLLESKEAGNTLVGTYSCGLTVVVPLSGDEPQAGAEPSAHATGGEAFSEEDLGLQQPLPWSHTFHIQPQFSREFRPRPPATYTEALARQARLLHGPERRAFLRLHKLVKECIFAIIAAADTYVPPSRSAAPSRQASQNAALAAAPGAAPDNQTPEGRTGPASTSGSASAPDGGAEPLPPTFAHALALLIRHHSATHVDGPALEGLAAHPSYQHLTGTKVDNPSALASYYQLREELNHGYWGSVYAWTAGTRSARPSADGEAAAAAAAGAAAPPARPRAPLLAVVMCLEAFFASFAKGGEPSSLTEQCLKVVARSYEDLFNHLMPPPPGSAQKQQLQPLPITKTPSGRGVFAHPGGPNGEVPPPAAPPPHPPPPGPGQPHHDAGAAREPLPLEVAQQAYEILEPLEPRDSELLLVFASLIRVVARVGGPGCEDAVVDVGKWAVGLLLGSLAHTPEAEEAVLSFLWYLAGRDEAYAMLVLLKRQRMAGQKRKPQAGGRGVDVAAMLQAACALAAAPPEAAAAPAAAAGVAAAAGRGPASPRPKLPGIRPKSAKSFTASEAGAGGAPHDAPLHTYPPDSPALLPALQLAQLLSQDIQQLYRVSFREAIAGLSSVVYPPPMATGQIDVHSMWR